MFQFDMDIFKDNGNHTEFHQTARILDMAVGFNQQDPPTEVRWQALFSMSSLEGWCSPYKASVLMELVFMVKPKVIVEIGVFGGKSLVPMAYALRVIGAGKVYGIDPWDTQESIKGMEGINKDWWGSIDHQGILNGLVQKIGQFGLNNQIELLRTTSANAAPIRDIGILHLDGNHSEESAFFDVVKWVPLIKKGGLVVFDDLDWQGTGKAVEWLDANCIKLAEIKGENVWGIWVKP